MMCPHCKLPMSLVMDGLSMREIKSLRSKGMSIRDIHAAMTELGYGFSMATVGRFTRALSLQDGSTSTSPQTENKSSASAQPRRRGHGKKKRARKAI